MQSTAEAKKRPEQVQPAPKAVEPLPNPFLPKPAELPANPYEAAGQSRLQEVPKLKLPEPKPLEKQTGEPLSIAKLETEAGEAKITPAQKLHEKFAEMRRRMEEGEPPAIYHREKPENRPRGPKPEEEEGPPERLDTMSRKRTVYGNRPDLEAQAGLEAKKKKEKPKEGEQESTL